MIIQTFVKAIAIMATLCFGLGLILGIPAISLAPLIVVAGLAMLAWVIIPDAPCLSIEDRMDMSNRQVTILEYLQAINRSQETLLNLYETLLKKSYEDTELLGKLIAELSDNQRTGYSRMAEQLGFTAKAWEAAKTLTVAVIRYESAISHDKLTHSAELLEAAKSLVKAITMDK